MTLARKKESSGPSTGFTAVLRHARYVLRENVVTAFAFALFALIVLAALVTAYRFRKEPWLAMVVGAMASLTTATYLHPSDICLFVASGWILWHERESRMWRTFIVGLWIVSLPFLRILGAGLPLNRWILLELAFLVALCADSWLRGRAMSLRPEPLTATADIGKRLPA